MRHLLSILLLLAWVIPVAAQEYKTIAELQAALDGGAKKSGRHLDVAAGELRSDKTIVWPHVLGGVLRGHGTGESLVYSHPLSGPLTRLIVPGLEYRGALGAIRDIAIDGAPRNEIDAGFKRPTGPGVWLIKKGEGLGTGKLDFQNVTVSFYDTAFRFGDSWHSANCDESTFDRVWIDRCGVGFHSMSQMNMGFHWRSPIFRFTDVCYWIQGGGKWVIDDPFVPGYCDIFLKVDPNDQRPIGPHNGKIEVRNFRADWQAKNFQLLHVTPTYGANRPLTLPLDFEFDGGHISNLEYTRPMFVIGPGQTLTIRDWYGLPKECISWNCPPGTTCRVKIDNCRITVKDARDLIDDDAKGQARVHIEDCFTWSLEDVAPLHATVKGGVNSD